MLKENMIPGLVVRRNRLSVSPSTRYKDGDEVAHGYEEKEYEIHQFTFSQGHNRDAERNDNKIEDFCILKNKGTNSDELRFARCQCIEPWYLTNNER